MYVPKHFEQQDRGALLELMRLHPFATLIVLHESGTFVEHIPLLVSETGDRNLVLKGHVAKANPVWKAERAGSCIAVFHGPSSYISPSAYPSKKEHGRVVPTWNFVTVHASGTIEYIHDASWKLSFLETLTNEQESNQSQPWSVHDAPEEFTSRMLGAIVGFEIRVESLEGKWKLSQNQPAENYQGVIEALSDSGNPFSQAVANLMRRDAGDR